MIRYFYIPFLVLILFAFSVSGVTSSAKANSPQDVKTTPSKTPKKKILLKKKTVLPKKIDSQIRNYSI